MIVVANYHYPWLAIIIVKFTFLCLGFAKYRGAYPNQEYCSQGDPCIVCRFLLRIEGNFTGAKKIPRDEHQKQQNRSEPKLPGLTKSLGRIVLLHLLNSLYQVIPCPQA